MTDKPYSNPHPMPPIQNNDYHHRRLPPPPRNLPPRLLRAANNHQPGCTPSSSFLPHHLFRKQPPPPPSFLVDLRYLSTNRPSKPDVDSVVSEFCLPDPSEYNLCSPGHRAAATLSFPRWVDARDAMVSLWSSRLARSHEFSPILVSDAPSPAESADLCNRLKLVFVDWMEDVVYSCEAVKKWDFRLVKVMGEIEEVKPLLARKNRFRTLNPLVERREGLFVERESIERRLKEFRDAIYCVRDYLEGIHMEGNRVFAFPLSKEKDFDFDWYRIHLMVWRECKRLEEGLPIYAYRSDILWKVHGFQVEWTVS